MFLLLLANSLPIVLIYTLKFFFFFFCFWFCFVVFLKKIYPNLLTAVLQGSINRLVLQSFVFGGRSGLVTSCSVEMKKVDIVIYAPG
jgi:hypothetical protein